MPLLPTNSNEKTERGFLRLLQFSSIVSLGAMAGFVYAIKEVNPHVKVEFGLGAVSAALIMGGATWLFWRILLKKHHLEGTSAADSRIRRLSLIGLAAFLVLFMVGATLRALHNLPQDRYRDVIEGTIMALAVLGVLGVVFWKLVRFLEADHQRAVNEQEQGRDDG